MSSSAKRTHKKSKTGCGTCKLRKVKCNEEIPCGNCVKHRVLCDFLTNPPRDEPSQISATHLGQSSTLVFEDLNIRDLELFHQYSTSTSLSLWSNPLMRAFWQVQVPNIGLSYPFVLRGILSFAALHLAYLHPDKKDIYIPCSIQHQQLALKEVMGILPNVTAENCTALHLFSILNCFYTLGRPRDEHDFLVVGDCGISQWLVLFRGVLEFVIPFQEVMDRGPLGAILSIRQRRQQKRDLCISQSQADFLGDLRRLILNNSIDESRARIYLENINELEKSFVFVYNQANDVYEMGDVFNYLFLLSREYLLLLNEGTQEALVIFAYACVLFHKLELYWWMEGWSFHLMSNIWQFLDEQHKQWISWPVQEIGWSPA